MTVGGGHDTMHRPALARTETAWTHPYPTGPFSPICYANGGDPNPAPPTSAPAAPPVPAPGPGDPTPSEPRTFTQEQVSALAAREKDQGRRAGAGEALRGLAEKHGLKDAEELDQFLTASTAARDAQLTEQQRREQELAQREQELARREAAAEEARRTAERRSVLVGLGATGDNLNDAALLLRVDDNADQAAVQTAADALKQRRPELFGATPPPAPGTPPPAPGGAPAGTGAPPAPRPTGKPGDRGREMARRRGHLKNNAG